MFASIDLSKLGVAWAKKQTFLELKVQMTVNAKAKNSTGELAGCRVDPATDSNLTVWPWLVILVFHVQGLAR